MERYNRVGVNFNGSLSQRPTATLETPPSSISLPPKPHLREPSVFSFLRPESPRPSAAATGDAQHRVAVGPHSAAEDTELSIFDAERYFNEGGGQATAKTTIILNTLTDGDLSTNTRASSVSSAEGYGRSGGGARRAYYSTPTASSEASWNSQSGLLSNPPGSVAVTMRAFPAKDPRKAPSSLGERRFFGRRCPCTGKKSVDIEEKYSEPKTPARSSSKRRTFKPEDVNLSSIPEKEISKEIKKEFGIEELMTVKITSGNWGKDDAFFNGPLLVSPPEKHIPSEIGHRIVNSGRPFVESAGFSFPRPPSDLDPPRDSLEVFRPAKEPPQTVKVTPKPSPGDGDFRRSFTYPTSPKARPEDDAASDTSSDLFEIESLSTQMGYRRRDSLDELESRRFVGSAAASGILHFRRSLDEAAGTAASAGAATPSIAPSECYPPSEVSVVWSVATAEGFDRTSVANFSSAASDYDEFRFMQEEHDRFAAAIGDVGGGRRKSGGILGCRSEKAVSVGPNPVRFAPPVEPEPLARVEKLASGNLVPMRSHSARMYLPVQSR